MTHAKLTRLAMKSPKRVQSGVAGLDALTRGGLLHGGLYIVQGPPGAGKTILANQICFSLARAGEKSLFATVLSEAHSRMMMHLSSMEFFDDALIPSKVQYLSAFSTLASDGIKALMDLLRREMRSHGASLLVIDGFAAIEQSAPSDLDFKKFVHELQVQAGMLGCTTLLLTSSRTVRGFHPEHTMVDGLIELQDVHLLRRTEREIEISKFRGSESLRGRHPYEIRNNGITIYPRTEMLLRDAAPNADDVSQRLSSGCKDLDAMLHGGIPRSTTTLVVGPSGSGKTTLGLTFLANAPKNEPGLLFTFYESEQRAIDKAKRIGLDFKSEVVWQSPTEQMLDVLGARLLDAVERRKVRRLVIDSLPGFQTSTMTPERIPRFFAALFNELRRQSVTTICTVESPYLFRSDVKVPVEGVSALAENMIVLRLDDKSGCLCRTISVAKLRDSGFDERLRELRISDQGLSIVDRAPS